MQPGVGQPGQRSIPQANRDRPWENRETLQKIPPVTVNLQKIPPVIVSLQKIHPVVLQDGKCTQKIGFITLLFAPPGSICQCPRSMR